MYEQLRPYTREEFLSKLPEQVMNGGKVVPVRSEIAKKLGVVAESSEEAEVHTEVVAHERKGKVFRREDLAVIKVRSEKGKNTALIKVLASESIETVYKYAEKYSESGGKFVLRRNYPPEEFRRGDARSLKELGLCPSEVLIMKEVTNCTVCQHCYAI
eukprot:TRINITY_DN7337_c0_g1_i23.p2 TRINITY_DN7337_c0_g1~~TRINITY_DN7337_c0_g1_i23.p2  ORF type:complete len:158 (-),score=36.43 TRINITY_DN7337_c0_g1_i23:112-585(-)